MATLTQWTWVWASSGRWWKTGKPGMLKSMGSQRVGHDWTIELMWVPRVGSNLHPLHWKLRVLTMELPRKSHQCSFFKLEDNCFTILCWLLPYQNMTQPLCYVLVAQSCLTLWDPMDWTGACQAYLSTGFSRQEYRSGSHFFFQGIFSIHMSSTSWTSPDSPPSHYWEVAREHLTSALLRSTKVWMLMWPQSL